MEYDSTKMHYQKFFMTIESKKRHSDVIKYYPKQWNDKDFGPFYGQKS